MNITMENFKTAKYDVFSIFDDRWGLCTAGTPREYNTMTIGWGTMGTILGTAKERKADHYRIYPGKPPDASDSAEGRRVYGLLFSREISEGSWNPGIKIGK